MRKCARIIILVILVLLFYSCTTTRYIPVETIKTDTTYISQIKIDSIYQRDSVYIEHKADTVFKYKYKYISKYIENHDTILREKVDTIRVAYPVEAKLTTWQTIKLSIGEYLAAGLALILALIGCKLLVGGKQR